MTKMHETRRDWKVFTVKTDSFFSMHSHCKGRMGCIYTALIKYSKHKACVSSGNSNSNGNTDGPDTAHHIYS